MDQLERPLADFVAGDFLTGLMDSSEPDGLGNPIEVALRDRPLDEGDTNALKQLLLLEWLPASVALDDGRL